VVVGLATRHASRAANGVPRSVKVERRRQRRKNSPAEKAGCFKTSRTLNGWGGCYPEEKARSGKIWFDGLGSLGCGEVSDFAWLGHAFFVRCGSRILRDPKCGKGALWRGFCGYGRALLAVRLVRRRPFPSWRCSPCLRPTKMYRKNSPRLRLSMYSSVTLDSEILKKRRRCHSAVREGTIARQDRRELKSNHSVGCGSGLIGSRRLL